MPSFLETVISTCTKIKCAGSFDLFFAFLVIICYNLVLVIIYVALFELCK